MAQLYSRYTSGTEFSAGAINGSILGTSGINPIVDRLNSISTDNCLITGSIISGTATNIYDNLSQNGSIYTGIFSGTSNFYTKYQTNNLIIGYVISGATMQNFLGDHLGSWIPMAVNVVYGTGSPPTASNTTEGTLFIQYIA